MSLIEAPSTPLHVLRMHKDPVNALFCSRDNERIYSGDAKGRVVISSTRSLRPIADWLAHTNAILGVEELGENQIITHGRDNKIHVWERPEQSVAIRQVSAATLTESSAPPLCYSMDVNALNYCRFSLLPLSSSDETSALLAVPNLVESSQADVWTLPSRQRLHAAIGDSQCTSSKFSDGRTGNKTGIIMAMRLFHLPSTAVANGTLGLLCAYEDGGVILYRRTAPDGTQTIEGRGWEMMWRSKLHMESVMAMAVARDGSFALTVSADNLVGKYDLALGRSETALSGTVFRTKQPGNGAIAIRDDGRVCAVGGWDGKVRLYSTKTFKSLGTLVHHKQACQSLAFASSSDIGSREAVDDDEEDMTPQENLQRSRWLVSAGKDARVSIWALMSFEKRS
ncbi:WD40-repeat-containing domain protein [Pisolithus croceorrhizus]|nr:WD40-repeat-containing domain protein [Pisolithus croceorrhizus]KAI6125639.1 WD40-repeat-containing domain protein [Pisolithus croceorrhizus]KAI6169258.1 WD40-repeat-containing domain protein [Pisolithus thermaeus]